MLERRIYWAIFAFFLSSFFPEAVFAQSDTQKPIYIDISNGNDVSMREPISHTNPLSYKDDWLLSPFFSGGISSQGASVDVGFSIGESFAFVGSANWLGYASPIFLDVSFLSNLSIQSVFLDTFLGSVGTIKTQVNSIREVFVSISTTEEQIRTSIEMYNGLVAEINTYLQTLGREEISTIDLGDSLNLSQYASALDELYNVLGEIEQTNLEVIEQKIILDSISAGAFFELSPSVFGGRSIFNGFFFKGGFFWVRSNTQVLISIPNSLVGNLLSAVSLTASAEEKTKISESINALSSKPREKLSLSGRANYGNEFFPYLGIGYRTPSSGFGLVFDLGVMIGSRAEFNFTCQCSEPQKEALTIASIDVETLAQDFIPGIVEDILQFFPYVRLGIQYRF